MKKYDDSHMMPSGRHHIQYEDGIMAIGLCQTPRRSYVHKNGQKVYKLSLFEFETHAKTFYLWSIEHSYTDCIGMLREAGLTDLQSLAVARYASMHSQAWKDAA